MRDASLDFLRAITNTASPSGYESELGGLFRAYVEPSVDHIHVDVLGNVSAVVNPDAEFKIMLAAHMDEIGLMIHYISDNGFLHFQMIGGNDSVIADGQRVWVHGRERLAGVVGRKAAMLQAPDEQSQRPTTKDLSIDIGAASKSEAEKYVSLGDVVTFQPEFQSLIGNRAVGRAFDNKAGVAVVAETMRYLKEGGVLRPDVGVYGVATVQEEIGSRGAQIAAYRIHPQTALAVDMGQATDVPKLIPADYGELLLGKGPAISRGPNTNKKMFDMLLEAAEAKAIPYQVRPDPGTSPTDARLMQVNREGAATALLEVPLRYMHTPCEVLSLDDVDNCARLMAAYCECLTPGVDFTPST